MDYEKITSELKEKRRELLGRLEKLSKDVHHREEPYNSDSEEQALELQNLDVLFELDEESRHELNQINNALERLQDGSYESCVSCGAPIGEQRLEALAYTDTCIDCARTRDNES